MCVLLTRHLPHMLALLPSTLRYYNITMVLICCQTPWCRSLQKLRSLTYSAPCYVFTTGSEKYLECKLKLVLRTHMPSCFPSSCVTNSAVCVLVFQLKACSPFILSASGSLTSMAKIFQSVSPSSINARQPSTFTCFTSPCRPILKCETTRHIEERVHVQRKSGKEKERNGIQQQGG